MRKAIMLVVLACSICGCLFLSGCTEWKFKDMDAQQVAEKMQSEGVPIFKITALTVETDGNNLLGKPNGYTSKCNFIDNSLEKAYDEEVLGHPYIFDDEESVINEMSDYGGTIEVYSDESGAQARAKYLEAFNSPELGAFGVNAYIYQERNIVLRVSYDVPADQAKLYEDSLRSNK